VIQYAIISDPAGKDVAVIVHDTQAERLVYKGQPRSDLQRSFDFAIDRPVVVTQSFNRAMVRRKLSRNKPEYLRALLDRCVHTPYKVRAIEEASGSHRIDSLADKLEREYLLETNDGIQEAR
jgi:hypothetical protein